MIKQRIRRVLLLMLIFVLVGVNFSYAASGTAKVYYQTNGLGYGHVDRVTTLLREMGYTASNAGNITKSTFISGLNNSKVLINVAHGSSSGSIEFSDGLLSTSSIASQCPSLPNLKFVLLEGCYSSTPANKIYELGADSTIGFTGTVSASSQSNGIHAYVAYLVGYAKTNNITNSAANALTTLYNVYGSGAGAENAVIRGGSTTIY